MRIDPSGNKKVTGAKGSGDFLFSRVVKKVADNRYSIFFQGKENIVYSAKKLTPGNSLWLKLAWNNTRAIYEVEQIGNFSELSTFESALSDSSSSNYTSLRNRLNSLGLLFWRHYCLTRSAQVNHWQDWSLQELSALPLWGHMEKQFILPLKILGDKKGQDSLLYSQRISKELLQFNLELRADGRDWLFQLNRDAEKWHIQAYAAPLPENDQISRNWISLCRTWKKSQIDAKRHIKLLKEQLIITDLIREGVSSLDLEV